MKQIMIDKNTSQARLIHQKPLGHIMSVAAWHDPFLHPMCLSLSSVFQQVLSDIDDTLLCSGARFPAGLGTAATELKMVFEYQECGDQFGFILERDLYSGQ